MTGAYCLAMASNYNLSPRPAAVLVADGRARLIRRRESYRDLLACEVFAEEREETGTESRLSTANRSL
jgi:diaminopimelate decarboxylase